jgi:hypothetical protein
VNLKPEHQQPQAETDNDPGEQAQSLVGAHRRPPCVARAESPIGWR